VGEAPLASRRVLVTRAADQAGELVEALAGLGAEVVTVPLLRFTGVDDLEQARRALGPGARYDLVILTSANAARMLAETAARCGVDFRQAMARASRVIASGPATAAELEQAGCTDVLIPPEFSAAGIAALLDGQVRGRSVLLPRGEQALPWLPRWLRESGAVVEEVTLYRTEPDPDAVPMLRAELARGVDVVTFASPSAVGAFVAGAGEGGGLGPGVVVACIGPTTATAAREAGLEPAVVADEHSAAGLARAIGDHFQR